MRNPPAFHRLLLLSIAAFLAWPSPSSQAQPLPPARAAQDFRLVEAGQAQGEFEGRYKVGPTTCTVTPIKMAYEVRWGKRRQAMRFFFDSTSSDGKPIFISEDMGKGRDKFIFDDDRYDTGRFIRADGKVFVLKRIRGAGG